MKQTKRPWGKFKQFVLNKKCSVKILILKPKQQLSLQKHKKRKELWFFLTSGKVQLGKKKKKVRAGQVIRIKKNQPHRALATNKEFKILEISLGKFEEKDEIRIEDKYDRK